MQVISAGKLLISEPFLMDVNFYRTVIVIVEHNSSGTLGFVINQETNLHCNDLFDDFNCTNKVSLGGPVEQFSFHYLHTMDTLEGAVKLLPGLYWGGNFNTVKFLFNDGLIGNHSFRFFGGYSGWGQGQLEAEIQAKSWIVVKGRAEYIFGPAVDLWKTILRNEGKEHAWMSNAPHDVRLN